MSDKNPKKPAPPSDFDREAFKRAIAYVESSGGKSLNNMNSSAAGKYHFLYRNIKNDPELKGITKRQFINNPELQERIMDMAIDGTLKGYPSYEKKARALKGSYNTNLRVDEIAALTHFLGGSGVEKFLKNGGDYEVPGQNLEVPEYVSKFNKALGSDPGFKQDPIMKTKTTVQNEGLFNQNALGDKLPDGSYNTGAKPTIKDESIYANQFSKGGKLTGCGGPGEPPCPPDTVDGGTLGEVKLKGVRDTPEWKAYQDSLNVYFKSRNSYNKEVDQKRLEKLREIENQEWPDKEDKQKLLDYYSDRSNFRTYETLEKYKNDDYNLPPKNQLGEESYGLVDVNPPSEGLYDYVEDNLPLWIDPVTAKQIRNSGILPDKLVSTSEGGAHGVFKYPTKPVDKPSSKLKSRGINTQDINITSDADIQQTKTIPTLPYNLSNQRFPDVALPEGVQTPGTRLSVDKDGNLIRIQTREDYRKKNKRPNQYYAGGEIKTNDEDFTEFHGGGTHGENSLGGIPQGVGENGKLNTVEEDETKYSFDDGDYVFSNRIVL